MCSQGLSEPPPEGFTVWPWVRSVPAARGDCVTALLPNFGYFGVAPGSHHQSRPVGQEPNGAVFALNSPCGSLCGRRDGCAGWWFLLRKHPQLGSYLGRIPSELA